MTYRDETTRVIIANVSRRGMLKGVVAAGGLVVAAQIPGMRTALAYATGAEQMPNGVKTDPRIFLSIAKDGTVTIVAARAEMGNGAARTSLPMILADELDADWVRVRVVQGEGDEKKYGNQDTDGSRSVRHWIQPLRQCGATARRMLEEAAAKRWGVDPSEVEAVRHEVVHRPSGRKLGYGDVADEAAALPTPPVDKIRLKEPSAFRYIGKGNVPIVDLFDITTGRATYGQDVMRPGMKFAVIARSPVLGGKIVSFDATEALKVPGVEKVVQIDPTPAPAKYAPLAGVAVIATTTYAALKGRDALKIVWDDGPNKAYDSGAYKAMLEEANGKPGKIERNEGDVDKALASAAKVITREYYVPHLGACHDGAAGGDRTADQRQNRSVGAVAEPGRRARGHRQEGWPERGRRRGAQHPARRWVRPQVEVRLRYRSSVARQGDRGRARGGRMDTRGRYPARLLPHRDG
jgi:isoquinoline 1-oxidoreductase subunit beta